MLIIVKGRAVEIMNWGTHGGSYIHVAARQEEERWCPAPVLRIAIEDTEKHICN
jgi:hypothetical protein